MAPPDQALRDHLRRVLLTLEDAVALDVRGRTDAAVLVALYLDHDQLEPS